MDTEKIIEVNPNEVTEITPSLKLQEGERLTDEKIEQFEKLLNTIKDQVKMMEEIWRVTMKEFNINSDILNKLDTYNREHRIPMPENLSDEEKALLDQLGKNIAENSEKVKENNKQISKNIILTRIIFKIQVYINPLSLFFQR